MKKITARILSLLLVCALLGGGAWATEETLVPVGEPVGILLDVHGVLVDSLTPFEGVGGKVSPAEDAGILPGDLLLSLDGKSMTGIDDLNAALAGKDGVSVEVTLLRKGHTATLSVTPAVDPSLGFARLGIRAGETLSGIGTVTYYDPSTGDFGALGHAIGVGGSEAAAIDGGEIYRVSLSDIQKGHVGKAGEIHGTIIGDPVGSAEKNTPVGIFGKLEEPLTAADPIPLGEAIPGKAHILCSLDASSTAYEVEIVKIDSQSRIRNITFRVTDPALLQKSGGVVRGMSGSPIIQDGKLVGAVTHVLVNDPT
ncbi:MAG: PDZ domain-containing protein, partial [Clostridia bacterium]|nr:PDZ domain-containing protein [Clostridia bacterium]